MTRLSKWKDESFLEEEAFEKLQRFIDLLIQWNARINLTGLESREAIEEILIGESVLAAKAFSLSGKRVLDFGSGAGIPGLVWAVLDTTILLTSVEVRAKKVAFQKEVASQLQLDVEIMQGHFPDVVRHRKFDVIATRAVRMDQVLVLKSQELLDRGGSLLRFASSDATSDHWEIKSLSERSNLLILTL